MDISVGAVGAAVVAGLVSVLGLIISKEQKVSEFRQAWIDELRKCLISYLVNITAIGDVLRLKTAGSSTDVKDLTALYKALNEANHGIELRVNENEDAAKRLLHSMHEFEKLSQNNTDLTPQKIMKIEAAFLENSRKLLKFEWRRVKRGEKVFIWSKWIVIASTVTMIGYLVYLTAYPVTKTAIGAMKFPLETSPTELNNTPRLE